MCLALPAKVLTIDPGNDIAKVAVGGVKKDVSLALVDDICINDYVLVHAGYILSKINEQEALKTLNMFANIGTSN